MVVKLGVIDVALPLVVIGIGSVLKVAKGVTDEDSEVIVEVEADAEAEVEVTLWQTVCVLKACET